MARDKTATASDRTAATDENQGLAARLVELRTVVEENRKASVRDVSECKEALARLDVRVSALATKLDKAMGDIDRRARDLGQAHRDGAEQVRAAGEIARKMTDHMRVLDELREVQADPYEVIKPLQRQIALLEGDIKTTRAHIDRKFEALPKAKPIAWETRDDAERAGQRESARLDKERDEAHEAKERRRHGGAA